MFAFYATWGFDEFFRKIEFRNHALGRSAFSWLNFCSDQVFVRKKVYFLEKRIGVSISLVTKHLRVMKTQHLLFFLERKYENSMPFLMFLIQKNV